MMTLDEAVATYGQYAQDAKNKKLNETFKYYEQLAEWLSELQERRKAPEIIRCGECAKQYKPTCPFGVWINTPDDGHCHWAERRTE